MALVRGSPGDWGEVDLEGGRERDRRPSIAKPNVVLSDAFFHPVSDFR